MPAFDELGALVVELAAVEELLLLLAAVDDEVDVVWAVVVEEPGIV